MSCYVGLDASKRTTSICVIDESGSIVREGVVASDPKAIVGFLRGEGRRYKRVGLEAWSLASWLYVGLARAGLPVICIEARHAHSLLKSKRPNKTDRNDALGVAEIMRAGLYKSVHIKSLESQCIKAALAARKVLTIKTVDIENCISGTLLVFGAKLRRGGAKNTYARRVRLTVGADKFLKGLVDPLLAVRERMIEQLGVIDQWLNMTAKEDPVCRRLMTAPGVGPITALTYGNIGLAVTGIEINLPISADYSLGFWCPTIVAEKSAHVEESLKFMRETAGYSVLGDRDLAAKVESTRAATAAVLPGEEAFLMGAEAGTAIECTSDHVTHFNAVQIRNAERWVMSRNGDFSLARRMIGDDDRYRLGHRIEVI